LRSDNSGEFFLFGLADVVFFFGVPAEPAAFATEDTPAAFLRPPPFFFIGANEGRGENGSLEVFAMQDKGSGLSSADEYNLDDNGGACAL
jgi:hypothetical protein